MHIAVGTEACDQALLDLASEEWAKTGPFLRRLLDAEAFVEHYCIFIFKSSLLWRVSGVAQCRYRLSIARRAEIASASGLLTLRRHNLVHSSYVARTTVASTCQVVYFPHLRRPLLNTLLYLCTVGGLE